MWQFDLTLFMYLWSLVELPYIYALYNKTQIGAVGIYLFIHPSRWVLLIKHPYLIDVIDEEVGTLRAFSIL